VQGLYVLTSQVSSVGGYHDEGEEPPHASYHPRRDRPRGVQHNIRELFKAFSLMIYMYSSNKKTVKITCNRTLKKHAKTGGWIFGTC
jgi:hypothetical protein